MNIFVLDKSPSMAAQMLCDCHLRKMCLETAQILSGVMLRRGIALREGMPKPQNINHPVIVAADNDVSITWVEHYNLVLNVEFLHRFGKEHKFSKLCFEYSGALGLPNSSNGYIHLAKCCGNLDVSGLDIVSAYRKYYTEVKKPALQSKGLWNFTNRKDWTE
jgi:hypothetical protein